MAMDEKIEFTFNEYVYYCAMQHPELKLFFTELYNYGEKIDDMDSRVALKKFIASGDIMIEKEKECVEAYSKVESLGVVLSEYKKRYAYQIVEPAAKEGFAKNGKYDTTFASHPIKFNGLELNLEMLKSGKNPYLLDYLKWIEENKGINIELSGHERRLKELNEKLSRSLFGREKIRKSIEVVKGQIMYLEYQLAEGEKLKEKKETFEAFTPEQMEAIHNALSCLEESMNTSKDLKAAINEYNQIQIKYNAKRNRTGKWERAYYRMLSDGVVTEKRLVAINELFDKVLRNRNAKSFPEGLSSHKQDTVTNNLFGAIDWYISYTNSRTSKISDNSTKKTRK